MRIGMAADHGPFASKVQLRTLEEKERNKLLLWETRWRIEGKNGAASILGIHPSTLRVRMRKLGIVRPEIRAPD